MTDWSEPTFIEFFTRTTTCLHTTPQDAKLFYDLVLRLGSYPYITKPPSQGRVPRLDFPTFKTGLMALSGRLTATTPVASGFKFAGTAGRKHRRILFLALEEQITAPLTPEDERRKPRTDDDDEDLLDVLKLFEACRWEGPNPCLTYQGPQIPHRTAFRSSRSVPKGMVRVEKVWQLLRLSLVVKLWQFGINVDTPSIKDLDWRGVIRAIMASGGINLTTLPGYIQWPEFDRMFATTVSLSPTSICKKAHTHLAATSLRIPKPPLQAFYLSQSQLSAYTRPPNPEIQFIRLTPPPEAARYNPYPPFALSNPLLDMESHPLHHPRLKRIRSRNS